MTNVRTAQNTIPSNKYAPDLSHAVYKIEHERRGVQLQNNNSLLVSNGEIVEWETEPMMSIPHTSGIEHLSVNQ